MSKIMRTFETSFHSANFGSLCTSFTALQLNVKLKHARTVTDRAKGIGQFVKMAKEFETAGRRLEEVSDKVDKMLKKIGDRAADVTAGCEINEALDVLDNWLLQPRTDEGDLDAAKAFDKLFGGASHFVEKLPAPFNGYAKLLAEVTKVSFFATMYDVMRHGQATSGGRPMKDVLDSMDHPN